MKHYKMLNYLAAYLVIASNVASASPSTQYALKEFHPAPTGWQSIGPARKHHLIDLHIGLTQGNFDELENKLYDVSDPLSPNYGQHLTAQQVHELVKPTKTTYTLVQAWLHGKGVKANELKYSPGKDWIFVTLNVSRAEDLLDTTYSVFRHDTGRFAIRAPSWSLPRHLHYHVSTIQPTNSFFALTAKPRQPREAHDSAPHGTLSARSNISDVCSFDLVTPTCLRTLYGTINYTAQAAHKNRMSLTNFGGEVNNRSDLRLFLSQYRPEAVPGAQSFKTYVVNHGYHAQRPDNASQFAVDIAVEGNLDAEQMLGIGYPTPLFTYNTGGSPPFHPDQATPENTNEPYLVWQHFVLNQHDPPPLISASYADDEQTVPPSFAKAACRQFAQLGARGISYLAASGDDGVGNHCFSNDGNNTFKFLPEFPPSCPYVTAVGATMHFSPEKAANFARFYSGAGYSNYFPRPDYQKKVVRAYTQKFLKGAYVGLFNRSGRAYPDVAAQGVNLAIVWNGTQFTEGGTSASTPIFSGVMALVNDALLAKGHTPLGFLNPFIYAVGSKGFTDVAFGHGGGCATNGFPPVRGWDPVTGYGTPKFHALIRLASEARELAAVKRAKMRF